MKNLNFLSFALFISIIIISTSCSPVLSQSKNRLKQWQQAINALNQTEFIKTYRIYKDSIEQVTANYHSIKLDEHPDDINEIAKGYEAGLVKFDRMLDDMKSDFSERTMRKIILNKPDRYAQTFEERLEFALNTMDSKCLYLMDKAFYKYDEYSALAIMEYALIFGIAKELVKELVGLIGKMSKKMEGISADYIEKNLTRDLRIKRWDEY